MPTRSDFEAGADKFATAAELVDQLAASAASAGAAQILRGGSLGRQVPLQIASAAVSAQRCLAAITQAAEICLQRAAIIAEYEEHLQMYDIAYERYERVSRAWTAQHSAWFLDETDQVAKPIDVPQPPTRPTAPPDWAQVRRL
ncbi:MAG: hypothetical protein ACI9TF_001102 [Paracrocinitomix sp.]|jgi:hypothetical protein